jgi:hypothetical protein
VGDKRPRQGNALDERASRIYRERKRHLLNDPDAEVLAFHLLSRPEQAMYRQMARDEMEVQARVRPGA